MTKDAFARTKVAARSSRPIRRAVRRAVAPQLPFIPFGLAPLVGLVLVFLVALGPMAFAWVQDPATRATREALAEIGAVWATPKVSGQWVVLEGAPPSREAAIIAIDAVQKARAGTLLGPAAPVTRVTERFTWTADPARPAAPGFGERQVMPDTASPAAGSGPPATPPPAPRALAPPQTAPASTSTCDAFMSALLASSTIEFDKGSAAIRPANAQLIDGIVRIASTCPGVLRIEGHTDDSGSPGTNAALSRQRATAVREALIQRGIAPERISADGYGAARPIADNSDETGRARNRRIEIRVVPPPT